MLKICDSTINPGFRAIILCLSGSFFSRYYRPKEILLWPVTKQKRTPPKIIPPGPNTSKYKYLDPPVQILQCQFEANSPPL